MAGVTSSQLRNDLTPTLYYSSPGRGYAIKHLMDSISEIIDTPQMQNVALVGLGHLGRAIVDYFQGRSPKLQIIASIDAYPGKINRVIHGCRCYYTYEMERMIKENNITVVILSMPAHET